MIPLMPFEPPRWWWTGLIVALLLLALGGALNAVEQGMRDNYATDGCGFPYGGPRAPEEQPEDVDCSAQRLSLGIVDAVSRATMGPGIAAAILAGVYLLGSAIATAIGRRDDGGPGGNVGSEQEVEHKEKEGKGNGREREGGGSR